MTIKQYDTVLLKDDRTAVIVEVLDEYHFIADVGDSTESWDTIDVAMSDIKNIVSKST